MTYNFDPERWYDMERSDLEHRHAAGRLTTDGFEAALVDLQDRYESMMDRLNSVADFPGSTPPGATGDHGEPRR
jgi:hypothetical protein